MRVLVTGAGGLIGGRLAHLLAEQWLCGRRGPPRVAAARRPRDRSPGPPFHGVARIGPGGRPTGRGRPFRRLLHGRGLRAASPGGPRSERDGPLGTSRARCRARGLRLVALSTDQVLAGDRAFASEAVPPRPLHVYGRTKLEGEQAVLAEHPDAAAVRLPLMIGRGHGARGTASESILWSLRAGRSVRLFTDEYRTPVDPESLAAALVTLLRGRATGLFHLGGPERLSRYELGLRVARAFSLPASRLEPVPQSTPRGPPAPARPVARLGPRPARAGLLAPPARRRDPGKPPRRRLI